MPVIHNQSSRHRAPGDPVLSFLRTFRVVEDLQLFALGQHPRLDIQQAAAHADGTHELIVGAGSQSDIFTFTVTCDGRILSATVWDRCPDLETLVLQRCRDYANGAMTPPGSAQTPCRFGGHERAALAKSSVRTA
jgi:hypothetical protein